MFRVSQHPSSGVLKTVTAASGTGHNTGAATSLQRGLIGTGLCESRATRTNPDRTLSLEMTRYPFYSRLSGPQGRSGRAENLVPTGIRSQDHQACSSVAIPTELPDPLRRRYKL